MQNGRTTQPFFSPGRRPGPAGWVGGQRLGRPCGAASLSAVRRLPGIRPAVAHEGISPPARHGTLPTRSRVCRSAERLSSGRYRRRGLPAAQASAQGRLQGTPRQARRQAPRARNPRRPNARARNSGRAGTGGAFNAPSHARGWHSSRARRGGPRRAGAGCGPRQRHRRPGCPCATRAPVASK